MDTFSEPRLIIALDYEKLTPMEDLLEKLNPNQCRLKIGKAMFTRFGARLISDLGQRGYDIFLDLKFHDIPQQVAKACSAAAELGVWMLTVHASGGKSMLTAASKALQVYSENKPLLVAVTVLTSLNAEDLTTLGIHEDPTKHVSRLAQLAIDSGCDGMVCSPQEVSVLRSQFPNDCCLVTPGIRPLHSDKGDQQRTLTPNEALTAGSDYLVIGRPITEAKGPHLALDTILTLG